MVRAIEGCLLERLGLASFDAAPRERWASAFLRLVELSGLDSTYLLAVEGMHSEPGIETGPMTLCKSGLESWMPPGENRQEEERWEALVAACCERSCKDVLNRIPIHFRG